MKILVLNCGSSSIKYQLFEMPAGTVLARGTVERIGEAQSTATQTTSRGELRLTQPVADHTAAMAIVVAFLTDAAHGAIATVAAVDACGHRVVHGGEAARGSAVVDAQLEAVIEDCCDLAPLHNPANLTGLREARKVFGVPHVACFDTAFHQTIPRPAYMYALPFELYTEKRVRRYGFHGTSHKYVAARAAAMLGERPAAVDLITCHLGNGCSMTAVAGGRSIDTSMGFTPLEGLVMGTRSGSFDPAILLYLSEQGMTADELNRLVNKQSGLLGLSGLSNDMRDLESAAAGGHDRAELALAVFARTVRKYIGAYLTLLIRCRAIVFTGGIGEHGAAMRQRITAGLSHLGIALDDQRNQAAAGECDIAHPDSPIRILVIPTNEEWMIAEETYELVAPGDRDD